MAFSMPLRRIGCGHGDQALQEAASTGRTGCHDKTGKVPFLLGPDIANQ